MDINHTPDSIVLAIAFYLDVKSLLILSATCKRMKAITENNSIWESLYSDILQRREIFINRIQPRRPENEVDQDLGPCMDCGIEGLRTRCRHGEAMRKMKASNMKFAPPRAGVFEPWSIKKDQPRKGLVIELYKSVTFLGLYLLDGNNTEKGKVMRKLCKGSMPLKCASRLIVAQYSRGSKFLTELEKTWLPPTYPASANGWIEFVRDAITFIRFPWSCIGFKRKSLGDTYMLELGSSNGTTTREALDEMMADYIFWVFDLGYLEASDSTKDTAPLVCHYCKKRKTCGCVKDLADRFVKRRKLEGLISSTSRVEPVLVNATYLAGLGYEPSFVDIEKYCKWELKLNPSTEEISIRIVIDEVTCTLFQNGKVVLTSATSSDNIMSVYGKFKEEMDGIKSLREN